MDTRDGRIYRRLEDIPDEDKPFCKEMNVPPTERQRAMMRVGRNDSCPCGSGKKFKKCCLFRNRLHAR
jgi:uncharacterized protein YecA (UPF0149 family)